jgi:hypothetical protein
MKFCVAILISLFAICSSAQVVEVIMEKQQVIQGELLHFAVKCASEQDVEITVFTEGHLLMHQSSTLLPGETPFDVDTTAAATGRYFILLTGNGIHVEHEFLLKRS